MLYLFQERRVDKAVNRVREVERERERERERDVK